MAQSCPTLCNPMDCTHQAPPSMGFSRQEYWSGLPFPSPADLPDPGIEHGSPACRQTLYSLSHQGSPFTRACFPVSCLTSCFFISLDHSAFIPSKHKLQGLPWDSRAKTPSSRAGGSGSMPGQGSRSHIPQLRICTSQLNIPSASAKTQHSQIDKQAIKKKNKV